MAKIRNNSARMAHGEWSIGIYTGHSPLRCSPSPGLTNPVLTKQNVTDRLSAFVADPFMVRAKNVWYMFFEALNAIDGKGEIALATSPDASRWTYSQIVLSEPFHLSYPHVFQWGGNYFMVPETLGSKSVRLYRASQFPIRWYLETNLLHGRFADPTIFRYGKFWWMFCSNPDRHDTLNVFYSRRLTGPWKAHRKNPVIRGNSRTARPAGRVILYKNQLIRFTQDCVPFYGRQVLAFRVLELTPQQYRQEPLLPTPVLTAGKSGWNGVAMHHIDAHEIRRNNWIACVDAWGYWKDT